MGVSVIKKGKLKRMMRIIVDRPERANIKGLEKLIKKYFAIRKIIEKERREWMIIDL